MSEYVQPKSVKTTPLMRRVIIYAALLLVVFLLAFGPMWLKSRECSRNLSEAERQLNLARMQNALASAAIDALRGDYEPVRQAASSFFTSRVSCLRPIKLVRGIGKLVMRAASDETSEGVCLIQR